LRRIRLPENAKMHHVKASIENWVFIVAVPKRKSRTISTIKISNSFRILSGI
jgi:HSP20 family molecular chaperone IbpA